MKPLRLAAALALATAVALPANAAGPDAAMWNMGFSPGLSAKDCEQWNLDSEGFCYANDARNGLEVGHKFVTTQTVLVTGVRLYRVDPGDVRGSLWIDDKTLLARASFPAKKDHGWQDMAFPNPVVVVPGKTYIASYFTPGTQYAFQYDYFLTERTVGPIISLRSLTSTPNGVHCYDDDPCGQFPSEGFRSSSYWVSPIWRELSPEEITSLGETGISGGVVGASVVSYDTTAPVVKRIARSGSNVKVTFSEPVKASTVTRKTVSLVQGKTVVRSKLRLSGARLVIDPRPKLRAGKYQVLISEAVQDMAGNALAKPARLRFRIS